MLTPEFKQAYEQLNPKQKEAVDTIEGPVMVIAGPGTGKTTILTLRIANILRLTDTPPSSILALTFTEAGAQNMRIKLRKIIGDSALEVPIHTFHGFASSVITEWQDHFPHLSRSRQITDIEKEVMLREILKENKFSKLRPLGDPDLFINKIIGTISDAKGEAWTPEMIKDFAKSEIERIKNDPTSLSTRGKTKGELKGESLKRIQKCERTILLSLVYQKYEAKKEEDKKIDFDDLLFELLKTLREDQLLLQNLQEKYLYILVDEHQDTNDAQNLIVRTIADFFETPNLFVVGDEKQAIYRFQGASVENFLNFQKIWSSMKVISLTQNYRSHQHILDTSFKMIEQNYQTGQYLDLRIKLESENSENRRPLDLCIAPNIETEEEDIVNKLKILTKEEPEKSVAVIVRKNSEVSRMFSLLETNDIPAKAERGANIFSHPLGLLYFSLLEFLANPENTEALSETIALGLWGLDFQKQTELIKLARSGNLGKIEKEITVISNLKKEINESGVIEYLILVADLSGFTEIAKQNPLAMEVWRGIINLAETLTRANSIENPRELIKELLAYKKSADKKTIKINTGQNLAKVSIMTAHGAKGLEFDYVFLPYLMEETWRARNHRSYFILPKEKGDEDDEKDERRLFYVGLTRARKHICLSFHSTNSDGRIFTPLHFIDELDQNLISTTNLAQITGASPKQTIENREEKKNKEKIEYTKNVLLETGLSVTALNHFINCPSEFFYKSILKLPEAPTASSEKGTAMHEAMSNIWKNLTSNHVHIIIDTVTDYFKKSLLHKFEKEVVLEELITNAPKVAEALEEHFAHIGNISTESWVETYFEDKFKDEKIELKLHGKMDTIIEKENETSPNDSVGRVLVFDYKTKEAMSENAIRGETKSEDGNYFRQLVFYKILLEGSSRFKSKPIIPALVFIKPRPNGSSGRADSKGRCSTITLPITQSDIEKVKSEISSLIQSVWSGSFLTATCEDPDCKYCGYKKLAC